MHLCKFLHCGGKRIPTGINSATKSLELGAFLLSRLELLVGLEAMEGGRASVSHRHHPLPPQEI